MSLYKRLAARLPPGVQQELKRLHYARQIRKGTFDAEEPEVKRLSDLVRPGDWVVDVGANIGWYTRALSALVGEKGRVIAVEPLPPNFELLTANVRDLSNVTLLNVAASDAHEVAQMSAPWFPFGMQDFYSASITEGPGEHAVVALPLDALGIPAPVTLVKLDVEGHEAAALRGMEALVQRDMPTIIAEGRSPDVEAFLCGLGYVFEELPGSPNRIFRAAEASKERGVRGDPAGQDGP